jgi:pyruvate,water dikinase
VGLARLEFTIASHIQAHALALIHFDSAGSGSQSEARRSHRLVRRQTAVLRRQACAGNATIAAAFYPKPVILRLSDFKTNEYANLQGGAEFEPSEDNPMIGWRGASRYYDEKCRDGLALECRAMKMVRDEMGLTNVIHMIPRRTPGEGRAVLAEMAKHGLVGARNGLEVYVMCEIPSNVVLADQFSEVFDGLHRLQRPDPADSRTGPRFGPRGAPFR